MAKKLTGYQVIQEAIKPAPSFYRRSEQWKSPKLFVTLQTSSFTIHKAQFCHWHILQLREASRLPLDVNKAAVP
jgi:hypothetical protein